MPGAHDEVYHLHGVFSQTLVSEPRSYGFLSALTALSSLATPQSKEELGGHTLGLGVGGGLYKKRNRE